MSPKFFPSLAGITLVLTACLLISCGGSGVESAATTAGAPSTGTPASVTSNLPATPPAPAPLVSAPTPLAGGSVSFTGWGTAHSEVLTKAADSAYQCKPNAGSELVGSFRLYANDCVISLQVSNATLRDYIAGTYDLSPILQQFSLKFKDEVDTIVVMADSGLDNPGTSPLYGRYNTVDTRTTGRARRLMGYLEFPFALGSVINGPFLHEFVHEWANRGILPNEIDIGHWGYASVGGQLGGFDIDTLVQPNPQQIELYKGGMKQCTSLAGAPQNWVDYCNQIRAFGGFANGGNSVPYAEVELWAMGLLADNQVRTVQVARDAVSVDPSIGTFIVLGWDYFSVANMRARLGNVAPNISTSQKQFRAAVLILTSDDIVTAATLNRVASDLDIMQSRGVAEAMRGCANNCLIYHNFYTATRNQGSIAFGDLRTLKR